MADISAEITKIESAVYGEEVRESICDALQKMNSDLNTAIGTQVIDRATVDSILASEALSLKYSNYTEVTDQTDLNVFAGSPGNYWIPQAKATTLSHMPVSRSGRLIVFPAKGTGSNDDGGIQLFISSQLGASEVWIRGWKSTTWETWRKVVLDEELSNLKSAIKMATDNDVSYTLSKGYWISTTEPVTTTPESTTAARACCAIPCQEGDTFIITGTGFSSSHRLWAFINSSGVMLSKADSNASATDLEIIAPEGSSYLIVNMSTNYAYCVVGGRSLKEKVNDLALWTESDVPFKNKKSVNDLDLNNITAPGWYSWGSSHMPENAPSVGYVYGGRLVVYGDDSNSVQIVMTVVDPPSTFIRKKSSGTWTKWTRYLIETKPELPTYDELSKFFEYDNVLTSSMYLDWDLAVDDDRSVIMTMETKYTGATKPQIRFQCFATSGNRVHSSCRYMFNSSNEYIQQSFRIPNGLTIASFRFYIAIPQGGSLSVRNFSCKYESEVRHGTGGLIFHAHRGADKLYPPGSYNGIVAAARLGFQSCIGIPKFTADGVPVEFHDDGNISSAMAQTDGSAIPPDDDKRIDQLLYDELMQYSIGSPVDSTYADAKILKMDDFLRICAQTGMRPIFSIHTATAPSVEQWQTLKALTDKYGLTKYLSVKTGAGDVCQRVLSTFGNGGLYSIILLYTAASTDPILTRISSWISERGLDTSLTRLDCEFYEDAIFSDEVGAFQQAQLAAARGAGYTISAVLNTGSNQISDDTRALMDLGVTEFTDARMYSLGLNW